MIDALPERSRSVIVRFLADEPQADASRIDEWLGELAMKTCPRCAKPMRRFEAFNGMCEHCATKPPKREPTDAEVRILFGVPERYAHCTLESWSGDFPQALRGDGTALDVTLPEWSANPNGFALMVGVNGAGKTHAATAILAACVKQGYWCRWHSARFLADDLISEDPYSRPLWKALTHCELLVIDDLGAQRSTDAAQDRIAEVIDYRYMHKAPTVVTTNLDGRELLDREPRIASRLLSGIVFKFAGKDMRRRGGPA